MCIICNCGADGENFLASFSLSRDAMKKAKDEMMKCSSVDRRYDAIHKKMVRLIKEWNSIEQERENMIS